MQNSFAPGFAIALFENSVDGVLVTSPDGGAVLAANRAAARILGWSIEELCEMDCVGLVDPDDARWAAAIETRARDGHFRGLLRARRADGSTLDVDLSSALYTGMDGEPLAYVMFRDVSEYIGQVEEAATVTDIVESMTDAFCAVDSGLRITYMNHHAGRRLDVTIGEVEGQRLWDVFPAAREAVEECLVGVLTSGQAAVVELYYAPVDLHAEARLFPLRDGGVGVFFRDVGDRRAAEVEREELLVAERAARVAAEEAQVQLRRRATHDDLTGLLNRTGLSESVETVVAGGLVDSVCLVFADLDRFKRVNDSLGHATGDQVLTSFGERLGRLAPPGTLVARFGGDEFVLVVFDTDLQDVDAIASAVIGAGREPVTVQGPSGSTNTLFVTASVGIARSLQEHDLNHLLREADAALHRAKELGPERSAWFDQDLHDEVTEKLELERDLRAGVIGQLELHYQVAYDVTSGLPRHVEALTRWRHPVRGLVPPSVFIPVAEECGLIEPLGRWAIEQGARQAVEWDLEPGVRVWVNVSPRQLDSPDFAADLGAALRAAHCTPDRFGIEVTESALADDSGMIEQVSRVRELGVAVAIDDFGTEYSSLSRLAHAPVDIIKIDRSFVTQAVHDSGYALLEGIVYLAHSLGASVIAEGVETTQELARVIQAGCETASGYLLGRPVPGRDVRWQPAHPLGPTVPQQHHHQQRT